MNDKSTLLGGLSIKRKLVLIIMLVSATAIVLASAAFIGYEWFVFRDRMADDLSALAEMIGDNCRGAMSFDDAQDAEKVLLTLQAKEVIEFACLYRADGAVFATYQRDESASLEPPALSEDRSARFQSGRLIVWQPILLNNLPLGSVYLQSDLSELSALLRKSAAGVAIMILMSGAVAYALAARLQRTISEPVLSLAETAGSISASKDYSVRATKHSDDELGLLTDAFNQMLTQVQSSDYALRESEEKLRRIIDNIVGSFVYTHDLAGKFIYVSQSVTDVLGYSVEEHRSHFETYLTDHPANEQVREHTALSIQGIQQPPYEVQVYDKDGVVRWLEVAEVPVRDAAGDVVAVEGIAHDITERKRVAMALSESERNYRSLTEVSPVGIFKTDAEGQCLYANERWCQITGLVPEQAFGKGWANALYPDDRDRVVDEWNVACCSDSRFESEYRFQTRDGVITWVYGQAVTERDDKGKVIGYVGSITDISERKRLEDQLRQAQKMEAVGQLAGGVAHDFNNLLQAIMGYGEMALDQTEPGSAINEQVGEVLSAGERATTLVRQLLAFSRRQVLELENLDLNEVVSDLAKMIRRVIGEHIALGVHSEPGLMEVRADRGQIEQILMNLCVNARDAMPDGGRLSLDTSNVELDAEFCHDHSWANPGDYVLLSVTDAGEGMDGETREHIFEPFFTTKELGKGTGLGLSTVYGIVRQHKGMINVYSEVGVGTTFRIYLPMIERSEIVHEEEDVGPPPGGTETVLLAEDDDLVRRLATMVLRNAGYTVLATEDGEKAISEFEAHADEIDIALLDVVMPKLGGRAVCDAIRKSRPEMPVLFASGYSSDAVHTDFVLDEDMQLIQKPYHRDALLRKVRDVLDA